MMILVCLTPATDMAHAIQQVALATAVAVLQAILVMHAARDCWTIRPVETTHAPPIPVTAGGPVIPTTVTALAILLILRRIAVIARRDIRATRTVTRNLLKLLLVLSGWAAPLGVQALWAIQVIARVNWDEA